MTSKNSVTFGLITKRSSSLLKNINESSIDSNRLFENVKTMIDNKSSDYNIRSSIHKYLESLCNIESANKNYFQPLLLAEIFTENGNTELSDYIVNEYVNRVMYYIEDFVPVADYIGRHNLTESQNNMILNQSQLLSAADRIYKNHQQISKRFNLESKVSNVRSDNLKSVCENCAQYIDTYNLPIYQKINLSIEEMCYLLEKNGSDYNRADVAKYMTNYYLLSESHISSSDLKGIRKVIKESVMLEDIDQTQVNPYINMDCTDSCSSIEKMIQCFSAQQEKTIESLDKMVQDALMCTTQLDIINHIDLLFGFFLDIISKELFDINSVLNVVDNTYHVIYNRLFEEGNLDDLQVIDSLIDSIGSVLKSIRFRSSNSIEDTSVISAISMYQDKLEQYINELGRVYNDLYDNNNINAIVYVNQESTQQKEEKEKFKLFKFHNLVRAAYGLNKYLKEKEKNMLNKTKDKVNEFVAKANQILFGESFEENFMHYIGEDNKADICVAIYPMNENNENSMKQFLSEVCFNYNNSLGDSSIRSYYILGSNIAEIHVKESSLIELSDKDKEQINESISPDVEVYLRLLEYGDNLNDTLSRLNYSTKEIVNLIESADNFSYEKFQLALEAMSIIGIDKEDIELFGEKFNNYSFNKAIQLNESVNKLQEANVNRLVKSYESLEDIPTEIQLEAYAILLSLLEAVPKVTKPKVEKNGYDSIEDHDNDEDEEDDDEDDDSKDKEKKEESPLDIVNRKYNEWRPDKHIDLTKIKLAINGLKAKFSDFSQKEKELSRTVDLYSGKLMKDIKSALVSDRREAIIKGSIIPSFSKCIKTCIALAGLGIVTANPLVPIVGAITGLALSNHLTKKERLLLLDDIEVEMEVLNKEIQYAENHDQLKKMRVLLRYKKDLQRQYQRIRYNIRIGKDILPGSAVGFESRDDD